MTPVMPFGEPKKARIMVIGHDPRLQNSQAEAKVVFFLDLAFRDNIPLPRPTWGPSAQKYDLAMALWGYVEHLAGREVSPDELYVTNLCNEFLEHSPGSGTVLIPDDKAELGVKEIEQAVAEGHFKVILSMAVQPFYHLYRLGFLDEDSELLRRFLAGACPRPDKAAQGVYVQSGKAPFLEVCGQRFHHRGVPVIPVVHVKMWPLKPKMQKYEQPMRDAHRQVQTELRAAAAALSST